MTLSKLLIFFASTLPLSAVAQSDLCWREVYPAIPGEWAQYGYVVEVGNRFQTIRAATVQLWAISYTRDEAQQRKLNHQEVLGTLVRTTTSDNTGRFKLGDLQPGFYEVRALLRGHESANAYIEKQRQPMAPWAGRGLRIALSHRDKGCSRIYPAGQDDTDCGSLSCEALPFGKTRILHADGTPLNRKQLHFYDHGKVRPASPAFTLTTSEDGFVTTTSAGKCYDISFDPGGYMHLCFSNKPARPDITVVLPPIPNPFLPR
jgi:hypothetical protein